jgi:hypothetical protein
VVEIHRDSVVVEVDDLAGQAVLGLDLVADGDRLPEHVLERVAVVLPDALVRILAVGLFGRDLEQLGVARLQADERLLEPGDHLVVPDLDGERFELPFGLLVREAGLLGQRLVGGVEDGAVREPSHVLDRHRVAL